LAFLLKDARIFLKHRSAKPQPKKEASEKAKKQENKKKKTASRQHIRCAVLEGLVSCILWSQS
jgi:hypothetical protein